MTPLRRPKGALLAHAKEIVSGTLSSSYRGPRLYTLSASFDDGSGFAGELTWRNLTQAQVRELVRFYQGRNGERELAKREGWELGSDEPPIPPTERRFG